MEIVNNLATTWSRNMILMSNPTKIHTSYSLKLSERPKNLSNFHFVMYSSRTSFKPWWYTCQWCSRVIFVESQALRVGSPQCCFKCSTS